ncbi:hypothetical protein [Fructobacillus parabroussonetiae]|uniref:Uncharacterized protein n=1 Tax=Fructobacillus parabroussonetiae TaxID=2713174 RepID=A0ABS5QVW4_9LACO|nr:hypothetical protein [Fructobacillus parabroussonetiae]MBS9337339.1 hypothetical protein [Fructobacillus parabroussonetiae]
MQAIFDELLDNALKRVYKVTFYNGETALVTVFKETGEYHYSGFVEEEYTNLFPDKIEKAVRQKMLQHGVSLDKHFSIGQPLRKMGSFYFISMTRLQDDDDILKYEISYGQQIIDGYAWLDKKTGKFTYEGNAIILTKEGTIENALRRMAYSIHGSLEHLATGVG